MVRDDKPRRSSVSEVHDWKAIGDYGVADGCDKDREGRRRKRSGTWP